MGWKGRSGVDEGDFTFTLQSSAWPYQGKSPHGSVRQFSDAPQSLFDAAPIRKKDNAMILEHSDRTPQIDATAFVAPNALVCGDVTLGKNVRVMFGAQIVAESSPVTIGDNCIVLENAVIRGTEGFPVSIGKNCLIGPCAHLAGCTVEDAVFIATGASIFHGAVLKSGSEVSVGAVVHLKSVLQENVSVPIQWVAVGNPAQLFPPEDHDGIWAVQKPLNFPLSVYGVERPKSGEPNNMEKICRVMGQRLGTFRHEGTDAMKDMPNRE
jgi:carbonic anhydrase/acetyltransferase-like protein (isoleucine patch superfamily)